MKKNSAPIKQRHLRSSVTETEEKPISQNFTHNAAKDRPKQEILETAETREDILRRKTLKYLRALVNGNGIKPEEITISDFSNVRIYQFYAHTSMRLVPQYQTRTIPGRDTKAEHMQGPQAMQHALKRHIAETRNTATSRKTILDLLHTRIDKGFAIRDTRAHFPMFKKDFVLHESCTNCGHMGKIKCPSCHATGQILCSKCQGREQVICPACRGTTQVQLNGRSHSCQTCHAKGRINCDQCNGHGKLPCRPCASKGTTECRKCSGSGWLSHITSAQLEAHIQFTYDRPSLPPEVSRMIDVQGPSLVQKGDLQLEIYQPSEEEQRNEPEDTIYSVYDCHVPFGALQFQIKGKSLPATLFGFHGKLIDIPPFLEAITRKGAENLALAANAKGDVATLIRKAAKYRVIRDIIIQSVSDNSRKGLAKLQMRYPIGIQIETLNLLMQKADKAIHSITQHPRRNGMTTGFIFTALTAGIYYLSPARLWVQNTLIAPSAMAAIDLSLLAFHAVFTTLLAQIFATKTLHRALQGLAPPATIAHLAPPLRQSLWWAMAGTVIITITLLFLLFIAGLPLPQWLNLARI